MWGAYSTIENHWKFEWLTAIVWPPDSLEKNLMLGKNEGRRKKGMTEDEMVGWHH